MNKVIITGRITQPLELRTTGTGKDIVDYSLAINIDKDTTVFINCTTFGESAKTLCKYCDKGDLIAVDGQLRTSQYVDKENKKHTSTYVLTNRIEFLNTKKKENSTDTPVEKTVVEIDDDTLPF